MLDILVVSPTPSHPQNAGNRQRIFALLSRLKAFGHRVHFCFIRREWVSDEDIERMRQTWDEVTLLPYDRKLEKRSKGDVFGIDDWFLPELDRQLADLASRVKPQVVIAEYVFYSKALDYFGKDCFKVIDAHDVFTGRHEVLKRSGLEPSFFYTTAEEEGRGLDRADLVLAIQDEECKQLQEMTRSAVVTLSYVPDVPAGRPRTPSDIPRIGYIGSSNPLNVGCVAKCLRALDLAPFTQGRASICIAGGTATAMTDLPPGVVNAGKIDDLEAFYRSLDLVINPHEGGTGLKIKTVEGLAHGCASIGTTDAFLGLAPEAAFHAARSAAEVGVLVNRYVQDPAFRDEVAAESARLIRSYARAVERQTEIFRDIAALRRQADRPRLLYVTDIAFWEESLGNHARMAEQIRCARSFMDVDVFVFRSLSKKDRALLQKIVGRRGRVFSFKEYPGADVRQPIWIEATKTLSGFEAKSFGRQYFQTLEEHVQAHSYSGYVVQYIRLSYLRHVRNLPVLSIIDVHDVMSVRIRNFAHFGRDHFIKIDAREEFGILNQFQVVLAIQADEYAYLNRLFPGKIIYAPHVLSDVSRAERAPAGPLKIIFVGGDSPMNRDGLGWFLDQVWPALSHLGAEVHVAGEVCNSFAGGRRGVVLHGRIEKLPEFLRQADIAINPVFYGGGLKIKTVEYLCYGIPSVLTLEAAFGIPAEEGNAPFLPARSRREFVTQLRRLIEDTDLRKRLAETAFAFGRRHFGTVTGAQGFGAMASLARATSARLAPAMGHSAER